jgi:uncharacterized protein (DUF111 family)
MADPPGMTNVLRMAELDAARRFLESDTVLVLEADIDDTQPQIYAYVCERLLEAGALDVCLQNVIMKKSRPGILLTVLSDARNFDKISTSSFVRRPRSVCAIIRQPHQAAAFMRQGAGGRRDCEG